MNINEPCTCTEPATTALDPNGNILTGSTGEICGPCQLRSYQPTTPCREHDPECPFCQIVAGTTNTPPRQYMEIYGHAIFEPLNPVTPGHMLITPTLHVTDATHDPSITAETMHRAAMLAKSKGHPCNLITSVGAEATQTIHHLHIHYIPRHPGDGLKLPWTPEVMDPGTNI